MRFQEIVESKQSCPHCGGPMFSEMVMNEKKDACYYKVKASAKVWPSAYASGRLVQCRKKGASNYGNKSESMDEAASAAQQAAIAINMKKHNVKPKNESTELEQEFDLIESIVESIAQRNGVESDVIWEDLESLDDDELYVFAVTSEPIMEYGDTKKGQKMLTKVQKRAVDRVVSKRADTDPAYAKKNSDTANRAWDRMTDKDLEEDWQKANKRDKTDGMSRKAVKAYRREHPGSKLKTAVTTKPSKLKRGSKASKRRKSYCSRSRGQMKMHNISCAKTPDKAICKARRRWNC